MIQLSVGLQGKKSSGGGGQSFSIDIDPTDLGLLVHLANATLPPFSGAVTVTGSVTILTGKTTKSVAGSVSGNTAIIGAVASKRLKVTAFSLITTYSAGSLGAIFTDGNGGTTLWSVLLQAISGSISGANLAKSEPAFLFGTSAGNALYLNPAGQSITYSVSYFDDDAT